MEIFSHSIENGYLKDAMGHRGTQFVKDKMPNRSFHLGWKHLPEQTKSLALLFIDHDAIPVCGFSWIHWTVANIDPTLGELPENASVDMHLLEGVNSWGGAIVPPEWKLDREDATGYGGCAPPDKEHCYTIKLFALDNSLQLSRGFYLNDMINQMQGHILDHAKLRVLYKTK